ncbi:hypothetical protein B0H16DRAFT_1746507 [Mycena metata]|uniref:Restriction of telomere capping protein 4 C-terminal domain-containing protein n=1 Tax=Mycena metata TaxID=1033252 RepID=A0AAD7GX67_9AGAR|nr:hypothetical protein B0H16DRAFT_1746507 [Mycena metata]
MTRKATAKHSNVKKMHEINEELRKQKQTIGLLSFLQRMVKDQVHEYLPVSKTISQQEKLRVEHTIVQIGKVAPYFERFEGHWPAHDMIAGYSLNMKGRRERDAKLEKLAESGGAVDDSEQEYEDESEVEDDMSRNKESKPKLKPTELEEDDEVEGEGEPEPEESPKRKKMKPNPKPKPQKPDHDNLFDSEDESPPNKGKSKALVAPPPKPSCHPSPRFDWSDVPSYCYNCDEEIPPTPNTHLLTLFRRCDTLIDKVGPQGKGVAHLELTICAAITQEKSIGPLTQRAVDNQWLTEPDFSALPARIRKFSTKLYQMMEDPSVLQDFAVWRNFRLNIGGGIFRFSKAVSKADFIYATLGKRCGYYGPKGESVINACLITMLSKHEDALAYALFDTLHDIVLANPRQFDAYDESSNLLLLEDFIFYILTPFAANLLIAEDLKIDVVDADDVRTTSNDYGEALHPDDQEIDEERPPSPKVPKVIKTEKRARFVVKDADKVPEKSPKPPQSTFKSGSAKPAVKSNEVKGNGGKRAFSLTDFEESDQPELKSQPEAIVKKEPVKSNSSRRHSARVPLFLAAPAPATVRAPHCSQQRVCSTHAKDTTHVPRLYPAPPAAVALHLPPFFTAPAPHHRARTAPLPAADLQHTCCLLNPTHVPRPSPPLPPL